MRVPTKPNGGHVLERRRRRARRLEAVEIEGRHEERPFVDVGKVPAIQVAGVKTASMYDLFLATR